MITDPKKAFRMLSRGYRFPPVFKKTVTDALSSGFGLAAAGAIQPGDVIAYISIDHDAIEPVNGELFSTVTSVTRRPDLDVRDNVLEVSHSGATFFPRVTSLVLLKRGN